MRSWWRGWPSSGEALRWLTCDLYPSDFVLRRAEADLEAHLVLFGATGDSFGPSKPQRLSKSAIVRMFVRNTICVHTIDELGK
jgi:hypothetical protein